MYFSLPCSVCPFTAMPSLPTAFHKHQADLNAHLALTSGLWFGGTAAEMPTESVSAPTPPKSPGLEMGGHTSLCFLILQVHRYPSNSIFLSFSAVGRPSPHVQLMTCCPIFAHTLAAYLFFSCMSHFCSGYSCPRMGKVQNSF